VYSPNSTWLVTSRHDTTRHVRHVEPMHLGLSSLSNSTAQHARLDALDTSNVSCRVERWRDEPSGIWAYVFGAACAWNPNSTWFVTSRHDNAVRFMRVGLIPQYANCQLLSFSAVNFQFDLDYLHSEPRWLRFFGDNRRVTILTKCTRKNNKQIVDNKTFALLFAADEWAPLRVALVVMCVSRRATRHARRARRDFSCAKMRVIDSVSCRVVTWQAKWNFDSRA